MSAETRYVDVTEGQLFYERAGTGDTVVLIHGRAGDRRHWDQQFPVLSRSFDAVRFDVRGFGKSTAIAEGKPYADHDDLVRLLDHLEVDRAHFVGWSMGSGVAGDFVLRYPERVESIVFVGPWLNGYSSPAAQSLYDGFAEVASAIGEGGPGVAVDAWMAVPFFRDTLCDSEAAARFREIASDNSFWEFTHQSPQRLLEPHAAGRASEIAAPTLVVTAEHDIPACKEIADLIEDSVETCEKVTMQGCGHLMHMEKPDEFNDCVVKFLQGGTR
jgi:3-oxoadipate enol-lactonase